MSGIETINFDIYFYMVTAQEWKRTSIPPASTLGVHVRPLETHTHDIPYRFIVKYYHCKIESATNKQALHNQTCPSLIPSNLYLEQFIVS